MFCIGFIFQWKWLLKPTVDDVISAVTRLQHVDFPEKGIKSIDEEELKIIFRNYSVAFQVFLTRIKERLTGSIMYMS